MKKLIAIAIVFALAAGAAFADTAIGGNVSVRAKLVDHTLGADGAQPVSNGQIETGYLQFSATNDDGDFGALFRFRKEGTTFHRAYTWWKPFDSLEVFLGQDPDGKFGWYNAWSHFQGQEGYQHIHDWGKWRAAAAFTNWDTFGIALTLKPIDGLAVNLVIPTGTDATDTAANKELREIWGGSLQLSATYDISEIGQVFFGYKMPGKNMFAKGYTDYSYGQFGFGFQLDGGIVDGLDIQAGFSTHLTNSDNAVDKAPLFFFLKANYAVNSDFGIKTRWRFTINGDGDTAFQDYIYIEKGTEFAFDIMPYYDLGFLTAYVNFGLRVMSRDTAFVSNIDKNGLAITGTEKSFLVFSINPYIRKSLGAGSIRVGALMEFNPISRNGGTPPTTGPGSLLGQYAYYNLKSRVNISIPVTFGFNF